LGPQEIVQRASDLLCPGLVAPERGPERAKEMGIGSRRLELKAHDATLYLPPSMRNHRLFCGAHPLISDVELPAI
jgi:hypothetical protein